MRKIHRFAFFYRKYWTIEQAEAATDYPAEYWRSHYRQGDVEGFDDGRIYLSAASCESWLECRSLRRLDAAFSSSKIFVDIPGSAG